MGKDANENTCVKPEGALGGATNWLYKYLNTRYLRLPDHVRIQVRNLKKDPAEWPKLSHPVPIRPITLRQSAACIQFLRNMPAKRDP
jgi:hypothetical protein